MLLQSIYRVTRKAASFEQGPGRQKALQQVRAAAPAAPSLGPCDPVVPMVPEASVAERVAIWSIGRFLSVNRGGGTLGFGDQALPSSLDNYSPFEKRQLVTC